MKFKYTAKITLSLEGDYVLEIPAIKELQVKSPHLSEVIQMGEMALKRYLEEQLKVGGYIPEDIREIYIRTEDLSEVMVLKLVVFVDENGFIRA
ncbi:MAG: hypothetical protein GXO39_02650 [Thermotogae bacterium]|nr:hypothetical protein [Thermotogota bacterium]